MSIELGSILLHPMFSLYNRLGNGVQSKPPEEKRWAQDKTTTWHIVK